MSEQRKAFVERKTKETDIKGKLNLDGRGEQREICTGVGFFDHMLDAFARHGFFDLTLSVKGDLHVDAHHTVEDTGIVIGDMIDKALGERAGIKRFGSCILPMDETLALCAIDLSGRPYFKLDATFSAPMVGEFDTSLVNEFFYALAFHAKMNLHLKILSGDNAHHEIEALFKAFARALDEAVTTDERIRGVLSTKGTL